MLMVISFLCGVFPGLIFGLIGVGSGILAIVLFSNFLNLPIHFALPIALLLTFVASLYTVSKNFRGAPVQRKGLLAIVASAVLIAPVSVYVSEFINPDILKAIFYIFLLFASFFMWPRKYERKNTEVYLTKKRFCVLCLTGLVAGSMNALLGVSGGIIIVPALTFVGFDVNKSIVTSAYVVLFTTIMSLMSYFYTRNDIMEFFYKEHVMIMLLVIGCIAGSALGNRFASHFSASLLKKVFSILVFCIAIFSLMSR